MLANCLSTSAFFLQIWHRCVVAVLSGGEKFFFLPRATCGGVAVEAGFFVVANVLKNVCKTKTASKIDGKIEVM